MTVDPGDPVFWKIASLGMTLWVLGGLRFRRWVVEGRIGQPRFSEPVETVLLWLVYSGGFAFVVFQVQQVLLRLSR